MDKNKTVVIFRMDKRGPYPGVTAVFPQLPADTHGSNVTCYAHVGQHGEASHAWYLTRTRPARPSEYRALARELRQVGYRLEAERTWKGLDIKSRIHLCKRYRVNFLAARHDYPPDDDQGGIRAYLTSP